MGGLLNAVLGFPVKTDDLLAVGDNPGFDRCAVCLPPR